MFANADAPVLLVPSLPYLHSNCQQSLLEKNQTCRAGNAAIANGFLKYDWNLAAQQYPGPPRDFVLYGSDQLRSGRGDVAAQDENLGIESVEKAHKGGSQVLQRAIHDIARAFISVGGSAKDGLGIRQLADAVHRQARRRRPMQMRPIGRFDRT